MYVSTVAKECKHYSQVCDLISTATKMHARLKTESDPEVGDNTLLRNLTGMQMTQVPSLILYMAPGGLLEVIPEYRGWIPKNK